MGISDNVIKISACLASPLNWRKNYLHFTKSPFQDLVLHYDYLEIPTFIPEQME